MINILFVIGTDPALTLMHTFELHGAVQILTHDGKKVPATDYISVANLYPHLLFSSVDVKLQHTPISDTGRHYHLKSFITHNFRYLM